MLNGNRIDSSDSSDVEEHQELAEVKPENHDFVEIDHNRPDDNDPAVNELYDDGERNRPTSASDSAGSSTTNESDDDLEMENIDHNVNNADDADGYTTLDSDSEGDDVVFNNEGIYNQENDAEPL